MRDGTGTSDLVWESGRASWRGKVGVEMRRAVKCYLVEG